MDYERAYGWKSNTFNESEIALFFECMQSCARRVLDTADIVREACSQHVSGSDILNHGDAHEGFVRAISRRSRSRKRGPHSSKSRIRRRTKLQPWLHQLTRSLLSWFRLRPVARSPRSMISFSLWHFTRSSLNS